MKILNYLFVPFVQAHTETGVETDYFGHHMGMMDLGSWSMGFRWIGGFFVILFWASVLMGVIYFIKHLAYSDLDKRGGDKKNETALSILEKRYAKGEIDKKEFEEKKKDIGYGNKST